MPNNNSITGRDDYIRDEALVYAIAHIQSLPREKQEVTNMCDMCKIARATIGLNTLAFYALGVERHTGIAVDIWPEDTSPEAEAYRAHFAAHVENWRAHNPPSA